MSEETQSNTTSNPIGHLSNLVPSQTIQKKRKHRRTKPKQNKNAAEAAASSSLEAQVQVHKDTPTNNNNNTNESHGNELESRDSPNIVSNTNGTKGNIRKKTSKNETKKKKKKNLSQEGTMDEAKISKRNKKKKNNKHPWKQMLPNEAVDPISLEPLSSLHYPPFALTISPPYEPVLEWPVPENDTTKPTSDLVKEAKKREQQVMEEQWGALLSQKKSEDVTIENQIPLSTQKHYHLFDGKVLAYYLVSTLQFIDPLNRRDLTRQEISNLDAYLAKHQLKKMRVLEAYDEKGVSLSSAGANAQSQSGRLRIRQEEARNLLNSLFSDSRGRDGVAVGRYTSASGIQPSRPRGRNRSQNRQDQEPQRTSPMDNADLWDQSEGIWGDESGLMIIDDDLNPGLRAGLNNAVVQMDSADNNTFAPSNWQPNYLAQRYAHHIRAHADNFPSLPTPSVEREVTTNQTEAPNQKVVSKSLSKIGKVVEKTDPKQVEKQRKAREEAVRKAELSRMTVEDAFKQMELGGYQELPSSSNGILQAPTAMKASEPTQGQIERNRSLAEALGVKPLTIRHQLKSGWARPTTYEMEKDEFGNELHITQYPDLLISEAKDRMSDLLRIEKKWKSFLEDDKAASCHLKPMDKPSRKFFHEYSDFWNLHTQSFDPAPKRYIQCTKTMDTRAPYPFLSDAVRSWKGPTLVAPSRTSGESTDVPLKRSFDNSVERVPLNVAPRSIPPGLDVPVGTMYDAQPMKGVLPASSTQEPTARFAPILEERERPKLVLDPRTKPLELPPMESAQQKVDALSLAAAYKREVSESMEKKKKQEEKKKKILASAFASDDEDSGTDSEWEEEEAMVSGSDEED